MLDMFFESMFSAIPSSFLKYLCPIITSLVTKIQTEPWGHTKSICTDMQNNHAQYRICGSLLVIILHWTGLKSMNMDWKSILASNSITIQWNKTSGKELWSL